MTLQELTAQTPVGKCFEWEGQKYLVELCIPPKRTCIVCAFYECLACECLSCMKYERIDGNRVIFVKQTPNEK